MEFIEYADAIVVAVESDLCWKAARSCTLNPVYKFSLFVLVGLTMIEIVSEKNIDEILPLIRSYQEFYEVDNICDVTNREFFGQFGLENPFGCQFLYRNDSVVIGFTTVFLTFSSAIAQKVGVMNDLYVVPAARGNGIGKSLIEKCYEYARSQGAFRLQWVTAPDNYAAQRLYDSLSTKTSVWRFYTYKS